MQTNFSLNSSCNTQNQVPAIKIYMYTHTRGSGRRRGSGSGRGLNGANSDACASTWRCSKWAVGNREGKESRKQGRGGSRQHLSVSRKAAVMCVPSKHQSDTAQFQLRSLSSQPHSPTPSAPTAPLFLSVWSSVAIHLTQLCPSILDCQRCLPVCQIPCNTLPLRWGLHKEGTRGGFAACRVSI